MHQLAYYTGSFDPMHTGHIWSIESAYKARPFKKLILGIGYNNVRKPNATRFELRAAMARATIANARLPFEVEILPFDYQRAIALTRKLAPTTDSLRIVGSDSLIGYIAEMQGRDEMWDHLLPHHHLVLARAMAGADLRELEAAVARMSPAVRTKFSYEVVGVQDKSIASTHVRQDPQAAYQQGFITKEVHDLIKQHSLYSQPAASKAK